MNKERSRVLMTTCNRISSLEVGKTLSKISKFNKIRQSMLMILLKEERVSISMPFYDYYRLFEI